MSKNCPTGIFRILVLLFLCISVQNVSGQNAMAKIIQVPDDYSRIQMALNAAGKNDIVRVAAGTYHENIFLRPGVTLEGGWDRDFARRDVRGNVTVINGSKRGGWIVLGATGAVLDGFTITGGRSPFVGSSLKIGSGIHCDSTSPTIINNIITANNAVGIFCNNSHAVIRNNTIRGNGLAGIYLEENCSVKIQGNQIAENALAGIQVGTDTGSFFQVSNNTIHHNGRTGINAVPASGTIYNNLIYKNEYAGIRCARSELAVINNTIVSNKAAGIVLEDPAGQPVVKNNIIAYNSETGIRSSGWTGTRNLVFANNRAGAFLGQYSWYTRLQFSGYEDPFTHTSAANIIADPLFVDPEEDDYHLQAGSPAIDAGDEAKQFQDVHFWPSLGTAQNDMGAYGGPFTLPEKRPVNIAPRADIALDEQQVYVGDRVVLDGADSLDPNGDALDFQWKLVQKPTASHAALIPESASGAIFTADQAGEYAVQLLLKDRWGLAGKPATRIIRVEQNRPPSAEIGRLARPVDVGDMVRFYTYNQKRQNGDVLLYHWEINRKPSRSNAVILNNGSQHPAFVMDQAGCYSISLVVNNGLRDSDPEIIHVCSKQGIVERKRTVPDDYPTIQSAIDTADPGDYIVVKSGIYRENIIVDKTVQLMGVGWPVIDGGSREDNRSTVLICYLDRMGTGKIEGFVITGGGSGAQGHGIKIVNSAPEIANNKIMGNRHVGVGMHGQKRFTGKTRIHHNFIHDNGVGVSSGLGAYGRIYDNNIYNNGVAGVAVKGLARPTIEDNRIYDNYIGIGIREEAYPEIIKNNIHDNVLGIAVNSGTKMAIPMQREYIVIQENQVRNNRQIGIFISSLQNSAILLRDNIIVDNNQQNEIRRRAGGVVVGYPDAARFALIMENNIIRDNRGKDVQQFLKSAKEPENRGNPENNMKRRTGGNKS